MIFLDPSEIFAYGVLAIFMVLGVAGFWIASRFKGFVALALRVVSVVLIIGGIVVTAAARAGSSDTSYSAPIYSPDHKHAIRIEDDRLPNNGRTIVYLYSSGSLIPIQVFFGTQGAVTSEDIHWVSASALQITYKSGEKLSCASSREVAVTVEPRASAAAKRIATVRPGLRRLSSHW